MLACLYQTTCAFKPQHPWPEARYAFPDHLVASGVGGKRVRWRLTHQRACSTSDGQPHGPTFLHALHSAGQSSTAPRVGCATQWGANADDLDTAGVETGSTWLHLLLLLVPCVHVGGCIKLLTYLVQVMSAVSLAGDGVLHGFLPVLPCGCLGVVDFCSRGQTRKR